MSRFQNVAPKEGVSGVGLAASGLEQQPTLQAPMVTGASSFNGTFVWGAALLLVGTGLVVWRKIGPRRFVLPGGLGGAGLLFVLAFVLGTGGPSLAEVSGEVASVLSRSQGINSLTGTNTCGVSTGPVTSLTKVQVIERGDRNQQGNYWPLRVNISGICKEQMPTCGAQHMSLCDPVERPLEATLSLRFRKTDYGKWNVEVVHP